MPQDLIKWALAVLFSLVVGSFGYTNRVHNLTDIRTEKSEARLIERLERVEDKLDRLLERGR